MINSKSFLAKVQSDRNTGILNYFQESLLPINCPDWLQNREIVSKHGSCWPQKHNATVKDSKQAMDLSIYWILKSSFESHGNSLKQVICSQHMVPGLSLQYNLYFKKSATEFTWYRALKSENRICEKKIQFWYGLMLQGYMVLVKHSILEQCNWSYILFSSWLKEINK